MRLYFIRHGQSVNNAGWGDPNFKDNHDPALTNIGIKQAQITASYLEQNQQITKKDIQNEQNRHGFGITRIYTSLMERAAHTASFTAQKLDIPFETWEQIHESGGIYKRGARKNPSGWRAGPGRGMKRTFQRCPCLKRWMSLGGGTVHLRQRRSVN